ncbi:MAG: spherulation-specific family 4 protein, partial [Sulfuricurvum sp.]
WNGVVGYTKVKNSFTNQAPTIYLNYDSNFSANARIVEQNGSKVWMLGSEHPTNSTIDQWINTIEIYNTSGGKVVGLSLDVEPWTQFENQNDVANKASWKAYLDLITYASDTLHKHGLKLSVSIPFWLDTLKTQVFPNNRPFDYDVIDVADEIIIMDYTTNKSSFIKNVEGELNYADKKLDKKVKLALECDPSVEPNVSFYFDPNSIALFLNLPIKNASFGGYVIHQLDTYADFNLSNAFLESKHFRGTLIPLYTYPTDESWNQIIKTNSNLETIAVINPQNGPISCSNVSLVDYQNGIKKLKENNIKVLGYVYTSYGARSLDKVKADIDLYYTCFNGMDGIFVDETNSSSVSSPYYQALYGYIKDHNLSSQVVINPGIYPDEAIIRASDVAVIYEEKSSEYNAIAVPAYVYNYTPGRFALLGYDTSDVSLEREQLEHFLDANIGYLYLTNDTLANPWDTLSAYYLKLLLSMSNL